MDGAFPCFSSSCWSQGKGSRGLGGARAFPQVALWEGQLEGDWVFYPERGGFPRAEETQARGCGQEADTRPVPTIQREWAATSLAPGLRGNSARFLSPPPVIPDPRFCPCGAKAGRQGSARAHTRSCPHHTLLPSPLVLVPSGGAAPSACTRAAVASSGQFQSCMSFSRLGDGAYY